MIYQKLSNEQLQQFPYPNLIAELIESGYSICTLGEHMGLGRCKEDSAEVLDRLRGNKEILASEALGLSKLFNVKFDYLFSDKLKTMDGKPLAYHRWYEWNQRSEKEYQERLQRQEIEDELRAKPYFLEFMRIAIKWNQEELRQAIAMLNELRIA